jgi:cation transport ATPase
MQDSTFIFCPARNEQVFRSIPTPGFLLKLRAGNKEKMAKTRQQLEAEGWKVASVTGGDHLKRTLEMYEELGIEIYLEEVKPEECEGCIECFTAGNETIYRIYSKPNHT